jgi:phenylpyruvate tautomerase
MPLLKIQTNAASSTPEAVDELLTTLSAKLAKHLGKPESYVMTSLEADARMTFGGTFAPVCYIEVKNIGRMTPEQTKSISSDFCQEIHSRLGVPKNRIYIEFADAQPHLWGWNGGTFA